MKKSSQTLIEVKEISKSYGDKVILDKVSFSLHEGEILSIVGFSGQGKSTLLNIICGLEIQNSGSIHLLDQNKYNYVTTRKKLLGYSSQSHSFYPELSVKENISYFGALYSIEHETLEKQKKDLLKLFELEHVVDNLGSALSEGQKKRLDLLCSLLHSPKVLILDEPTANLDFKLRDELLEYIKKLHKLEVSIIFVSHHLQEVEELNGRVCMLNNSKIKVLEHSKNLKKSFMEFVKHG